MRCARKIFGFTVLALYLAQVLGAQAIHLSQCAVDGHQHLHKHHDHQCHGHEHHGHEHHGHKHHGHTHAGHSHEHSHDRERVPEESPQHDGSDCWVCYVLGQAEDTAVASVATVSERVVPAIQPFAPDFFPTASRSGFHPRAPPVV